MADTATDGLNRREFVQGTVFGALLATGPGAVLSAPRVQGLDGAVASFVECLYALA